VHLSVFEEAGKYTLNEFYTERLADRRSFFTKLTQEQIMKWGNSLISKPLLKISSELHDIACQLFKNLMSYMGDRKSSKKSINHVKKHLKYTLYSAEELKDEVYAQVLKQIKGHSDYDKCMRGWNFFAILASCFAPSNALYNSILHYLKIEIETNSDQNLVKRANYIIVRLVNSFESKRKQIPSDDEITHIENMKQMMFPIYFFSETNTLIPTESYHTVRDLKNSIMNKLQLNVSKIAYYSLYEICIKENETEERFLDDLERFVDVTALWAKEKEEYSRIKKHIEFKIYLKVQLYYPYKEDDVDTITLLYVQTSYDVVTGKFNLTEEEIVQLAAIQLQIEGEKKSLEELSLLLERNPTRYIPVDKFKPTQKQQWCSKIIEQYTKLKFKNRLESKLTYLECLKNNTLYQAHQSVISFNKQFNLNNYDNLPEKMIIGIKPKGLSLLDLDKNELRYIPYKEIISWGVNNSIFVVVLKKKDGEFLKYYFDSHQVRIYIYILD
jgi:hypothetical protein